MEKVAASGNIEERVSEMNKALQDHLKATFVLNLDHHAMAKEEGVYTPPSIATLFSDPGINTPLIKRQPLVGLDLPFKTLCYAEPDTSEVYFAYTSAAFIARRQGLDPMTLKPYAESLSAVIDALGPEQLVETSLDSVSTGFGIIQVKSDFTYQESISRLKAVVEAQNDTRWFGEIDFQAEAEALGEEVHPTTLLLFGGPAPGGKAMEQTPKIGLDAFCQKLLVYEKDKGEVWIAFNDIVAFSKLYYGVATKPQEMINQRLSATFSKAVKKEQ